MTLTRVLLLFIAVTALAAGEAHSIGALRVSWGSCSYVQNQNFTGPGQVANLVVSLLGEDRDIRGSRVKIEIGVLPDDAWRFDAGQCNEGQLSVATAQLNKACPAAQGSNPLPIFNYGYDEWSGKAFLDMSNTHDPREDLNPATRYTLYQALFNHSFSDAGPQDPAQACGGADYPLCFVLFIPEAQILLSDFTTGEFNVEHEFVTWQDPSNSQLCPGHGDPFPPPVENSSTTWGRVKRLYR